jgi:acetyl esterase/lipase
MAYPMVLSSALLAFSAAPAPAPARPAVLQETFDIRYSTGPGAQALDVFAPKGAVNRPVVLFVHGGAWVFGDKNFFGLYRGVGRFFARHGAVAVCVNYRLSPRVRHPEHVKDVARAFAWVRAHVKDYGGDPDCILLCGHSAGGHIVSLLATDESYLNDPRLKLTTKDRAAIKGVMSVCGVYRIPTPDEFAVMMGDTINGFLQSSGRKTLAPATLAPYVLGPSRILNPFRLVFGGDYGAAAKAAPLTHVRKGLPPFLVLYAGREVSMLDGMAAEFAKALEDAGDAVDFRRIDGCTHNNILFKLDQADDPAAAALLAFLGKYGRPAAATP